jgi:hypothetical protein
MTQGLSNVVDEMSAGTHVGDGVQGLDAATIQG